MARDAKFAAEFEQIMLYFSQATSDSVGYGLHRQNDTDCGVRFIDGSVRLNSGRVFRHSTTVAQPGRSIITGARINLAQSISHATTINRHHSAVKIGRLFLGPAAAIVAPSVSNIRIAQVESFSAANASDYLKLALAAADKAAAISRRYYSGNFTVTMKADLTPVTQADVECEQAIRDVILGAFPEHGFYGEETGQTQADAEFLWLVDPIDGTKGFVRQYPFFSTQIALMHNGELILGVSSGTMMDEVAWAEKGQGAWLNGKRLRVSDVYDPDRAAVSTGNLKSLAAGDGWAALGDIVKCADRIRGYGDFYHYHLLAAGKIEAVIESDVNILDVAALSVIVTEAGGVFTNLNGEKPNLEIRSVLAANPSLHEKYLSQLQGYVA